MSDLEAYQQDMLNREREIIEALNRCVKAGGDPEAIETLRRELGVDPKYIDLRPTSVGG